jgi:hypothetical protein
MKNIGQFGMRICNEWVVPINFREREKKTVIFLYVELKKNRINVIDN